MNLRDVGLILLLITWVDTIILSLYNTLVRNLSILSIENLYEIGRNPYLFLMNIFLYFISISIMIKFTKKEERKNILKIYWGYPLITLLISIFYALIVSGTQLTTVPFKAPFIPMYIFLTLLVIFLYEIKIDASQISIYFKNNFLIVAISIELATYIIVRVIVGASPLVGGGFLALAIITILIASIKKKS